MQYGLVAVAVNTAGVEFINGVVLDDIDVHPLTVAVTLYTIPTLDVVTVGFCTPDINPAGVDVHEYVAFVIVVEYNVTAEFSHTGPLLLAIGALGMEFIVTVKGNDASLTHPFASTVLRLQLPGK